MMSAVCSSCCMLMLPVALPLPVALLLLSLLYLQQCGLLCVDVVPCSFPALSCEFATLDVSDALGKVRERG